MPSQENRKNTQTHLGASLHLGTVTSCDPATMAITVHTDGQQNLESMQGIPLASCFAHAMGFKETVLPQIQVLLLIAIARRERGNLWLRK